MPHVYKARVEHNGPVRRTEHHRLLRMLHRMLHRKLLHMLRNPDKLVGRMQVIKHIQSNHRHHKGSMHKLLEVFRLCHMLNISLILPKMKPITSHQYTQSQMPEKMRSMPLRTEQIIS